MFMRLLKARLRAFAEDARGSVTVEVVILLPLLYWTYCAMFVFFDAYRQTSINQKAAYTVSDMLSRETDPIDGNYLSNVQRMYEFLTRSHTDPKIRISVVRYRDSTKKFTVEWSKTRGGKSQLDDNAVQNWNDKLPAILDNERIIVVESWTDYVAPFNIGLADTPISTFVFTKPRFAPQLLWES